MDFKAVWPEHFSKIARHILAMANSGGGVIVFGVSETNNKLEAIGMDEILDKAKISNGLTPYLNSEIKYHVLDFPYHAPEYGPLDQKNFQVLIIEYDETHLPFVSKKSGEEIHQNKIYIRRGTSSAEASYEELQNLINIRISTQYSTSSELKLEEHLAQLKLLYSHIEQYKTVYVNSHFGRIAKLFEEARMGTKELISNSNYPKEDFDLFISRMIELKKSKIEVLLSK